MATTHPGRVAVLPLAVLTVSMLVSYERAKAEALGFDAKGGLMERAERLVLLGFGLLFSHWLIAVLWVMLVLTAFTVGPRFVKVWRQAAVERPAGPAEARAECCGPGRSPGGPRRTASEWRSRSRLRPPSS